MLLEIEVDSSDFKSKLERAKPNILRGLIRDSERIREVVDKTTRPYVPIETGELRKSISYYSDVRIEGDLYIQEFEYSAKNERTGFNYADIQHNYFLYNHPRGGQALYLYTGMHESERLVIREIEKIVEEAVQ